MPSSIKNSKNQIPRPKIGIRFSLLRGTQHERNLSNGYSYPTADRSPGLEGPRNPLPIDPGHASPTAFRGRPNARRTGDRRGYWDSVGLLQESHHGRNS